MHQKLEFLLKWIPYCKSLAKSLRPLLIYLHLGVKSIQLCLRRVLNLYAKDLMGILFIKKNEIEKIVKELLLVGSIMNSGSLFASPVLLVRKADDS